jgi:D-glycero-D-manno-heptose 1,7-bisphosphate phosphatase
VFFADEAMGTKCTGWCILAAQPVNPARTARTDPGGKQETGLGELYANSPFMKHAVFIERDGVLNAVRVNGRYQVIPTSTAEFTVIEEARAPLAKLRAAGFKIIVTTNQPGVSRGEISRRELDRMHDLLNRHLPIDDIFLCPHDEQDRCPCRKPKPGLLQEARFKWQLDMDHSFVVSDKWVDAGAAGACGCTSVLLRSPWNGNAHYDFLESDLAAAVERILSVHAGQPVLVGGG